ADGAARHSGVPLARALGPGRLAHDRGARLVWLGADRRSRDLDRLRRDVVTRRARPTTRLALGLARLALRLGSGTGRAVPLVPRARRGGQRPAGRGQLEPRRLRQQRCPAGAGDRDLGGSAAALVFEPARADRLSHVGGLLAVDRAVVELDPRELALASPLLG